MNSQVVSDCVRVVRTRTAVGTGYIDVGSLAVLVNYSLIYIAVFRYLYLLAVHADAACNSGLYIGARSILNATGLQAVAAQAFLAGGQGCFGGCGVGGVGRASLGINRCTWFGRQA